MASRSRWYECALSARCKKEKRVERFERCASDVALDWESWPSARARGGGTIGGGRRVREAVATVVAVVHIQVGFGTDAGSRAGGANAGGSGFAVVGLINVVGEIGVVGEAITLAKAAEAGVTDLGCGVEQSGDGPTGDVFEAARRALTGLTWPKRVLRSDSTHHESSWPAACMMSRARKLRDSSSRVSRAARGSLRLGLILNSCADGRAASRCKTQIESLVTRST